MNLFKNNNQMKKDKCPEENVAIESSDNEINKEIIN